MGLFVKKENEVKDDKSLYDLLGFSTKSEREKMIANVIGLTLAWQIRAMRYARGWSQEELAERIGTKQSVVSRLENPEIILHTTTDTLLRVAKAFDVALIARFTDWKKWMEMMLGGSALAAPCAYNQDDINKLAVEMEQQCQNDA